MRTTHEKEFQSWIEEKNIKVYDSLFEANPDSTIELKAGQKCTFVNGYGVKFSGLTIMGFCNRQDNMFTGEDTGRYVYLNYDCYWLPAKPESIIVEPE